jgi:hypothetical protein
VRPASFCRTHDKKPRPIRRLIGRAERSGFSQCGAPEVPVAAAAGLERRVGGENIKSDRLSPQAPEPAALFGGWRPEETDATAF